MVHAATRRRVATLLALAVVIAVMIAALAALFPGGGRSETEPESARSSTSSAPSGRAVTTTTLAPIPYVVQRGDTLSGIARRFGVTVAAIVAENEIADPDRLAEGQTLMIPPAPPVQLVIDPSVASWGRRVRLMLTGAQPSEAIRFEIVSPNGTFTGPPHVALPDGRGDVHARTRRTRRDVHRHCQRRPGNAGSGKLRRRSPRTVRRSLRTSGADAWRKLGPKDPVSPVGRQGWWCTRSEGGAP